MTDNSVDSLTLQRMLLEEFIGASPTKIFYNSRNKYYYAIVNGVLKSVHRLVAEKLLKNPFEHGDVNHKDSDRSNNSPSNLEWCDRSYNLKHSYKAGRKAAFQDKVGSQHHRSKAVIGVHQFTGGRVFLESINQGRKHGFSPPSICRVLKGQRSHYKNYTWKYDVRGRND